jgi:hypothetical protein
MKKSKQYITHKFNIFKILIINYLMHKTNTLIIQILFKA